jgi:hypothetical protein
MSEQVTVEHWIYSILAADSTLHGYVADRIFSHVAPNDATMPYVVMVKSSGNDVRAVDVRIMTGFSYIVKAVGMGASFVALENIANRLDTLLERKSGVVAGGIVLSCIRENPFSEVEIQDGVQYRHLGGIYRINAQ